MLLRYRAQQCLARFIPQYCVLCRQASNVALCGCCKTSIKSFKHSLCDYNLMRWPKIIDAMQPHSLAHLHAFGEYQFPLSYWLQQLKFKHKLLYAEILAELFVDSISPRTESLPQALIPAPLHLQRYLKRHFNQARVLSQSIGYRLCISVLDGALIRQINTPAQSQLNRQQRLNNISTAFISPVIAPSIKHVAIVDDVITTGATMQAMIDAITKANPKLKIEVWSIALALSSLDQIG